MWLTEWWAWLTDMEVQCTSSQMLVLLFTLYNLVVLVTRILRIDIGRVDELNAVADLVLYYDTALACFNLVVNDGYIRSLEEMSELVRCDGLAFALQVVASINTRWIAAWLDAGRADASLFRYIRAVRLLTLPSLLGDFEIFMSTLQSVWLPSILYGTATLSMLYSLEAAVKEYSIPVPSAVIIFAGCGISILIFAILAYINDHRVPEAHTRRISTMRRSVVLDHAETINATRDLYMDLRIGAVKDVFGVHLANEGDGKGGLLFNTIASKFRAEIMPKGATLDISIKGTKHLYVLVKGSLKGYTSANKTEIMTAPRTFGSVLADGQDRGACKVVVSQEQSELYSLDDSTIAELQRMYPAIAVSIRQRLQRQAIRRDVADVWSAFSHGILYCLLLSMMMVVALTFVIRIWQAR